MKKKKLYIWLLILSLFATSNGIHQKIRKGSLDVLSDDLQENLIQQFQSQHTTMSDQGQETEIKSDNQQNLGINERASIPQNYETFSSNLEESDNASSLSDEAPYQKDDSGMMSSPTITEQMNERNDQIHAQSNDQGNLDHSCHKAADVSGPRIVYKRQWTCKEIKNHPQHKESSRKSESNQKKKEPCDYVLPDRYNPHLSSPERVEPVHQRPHENIVPFSNPHRDNNQRPSQIHRREEVKRQWHDHIYDGNNRNKPSPTPHAGPQPTHYYPRENTFVRHPETHRSREVHSNHRKKVIARYQEAQPIHDVHHYHREDIIARRSERQPQGEVHRIHRTEIIAKHHESQPFHKPNSHPNRDVVVGGLRRIRERVFVKKEHIPDKQYWHEHRYGDYGSKVRAPNPRDHRRRPETSHRVIHSPQVLEHKPQNVHHSVPGNYVPHTSGHDQNVKHPHKKTKGDKEIGKNCDRVLTDEELMRLKMSYNNERNIPKKSDVQRQLKERQLREEVAKMRNEEKRALLDDVNEDDEEKEDEHSKRKKDKYSDDEIMKRVRKKREMRRLLREKKKKAKLARMRRIKERKRRNERRRTHKHKRNSLKSKKSRHKKDKSRRSREDDDDGRDRRDDREDDREREDDRRDREEDREDRDR